MPWDSRWRPVAGFPGYWVSQYGYVFNMRAGIVLLEWSNRWYGKYVTMMRGGKPMSRKVETLHRLAWPEYHQEPAARLAGEASNPMVELGAPLLASEHPQNS